MTEADWEAVCKRTFFVFAAFLVLLAIMWIFPDNQIAGAIAGLSLAVILLTSLLLAFSFISAFINREKGLFVFWMHIVTTWIALFVVNLFLMPSCPHFGGSWGCIGVGFMFVAFWAPIAGVVCIAAGVVKLNKTRGKN